MTQKIFPSIDIHYQFIEADGVRVFYREAGLSTAPVILLLHGFPSSSHQYRELMPLLASKFRVIAPDLPGFGFTEVPEKRQYVYSFDALAQTMQAFVEALALKQYTMFVFDYGAPVGFRLALTYPERVTGIISQNGNAYLEGLGEAWSPIKEYWSSPTVENRQIISDAILNLEGTRWQYFEGVDQIHAQYIAPESYTLDALLMERPGNKEIQLDLLLDYANNLKLYPEFQAYFRQAKFPMLIIWGKNDPFFVPEGAKAFLRDNSNAMVEFLETGHFALETHVYEIAQRIHEVMV